MYCENCGDVCDVVTDVRTLNALSNLFGGKWTLWWCPTCGKVEFRYCPRIRHDPEDRGPVYGAPNSPKLNESALTSSARRWC